MSKYIDADKLIAEIERRLKIVEPHKDTFESAAACRQELIWMKEYITSLQQEQPKFKVGDTIHKIGENTIFPMTIEKIYDGDYVCVTEHQQSFINIKFQDDYELVEQEQPEVELEKEIKNYPATKYAGDDEPSISEIISHFYKLGMLSNK